jgi:hypothetical protein
MDSMILGETIQLKASGDSLEGFWMPAGGNDGVGGVEVFYVSGADVFKVHIDTKKSDETDAAASSIGSVVIDGTTPKLYKFDVSNGNDLVRYRVEQVGKEDAEFVHLQFSQPLWSPN